MTLSLSTMECPDQHLPTELPIKTIKEYYGSGNTKGLIYVDPKRVDEVRGKARPIVFTDILANGVSFTGSSLKYNQNNLTFCFTDFAYGLPSALLYEYQLEGVDKDWKLLAAQNEVSYYGLPSGTYTFRVRLPGNEHSEATVK